MYYYSNFLPFHLNFLSFSVTSGNMLLVRVRSFFLLSLSEDCIFFAYLNTIEFLVTKEKYPKPNMIVTWYSLYTYASSCKMYDKSRTDETSVSPLFFFFRKEENKQKKNCTQNIICSMYEEAWKKWESTLAQEYVPRRQQ